MKTSLTQVHPDARRAAQARRPRARVLMIGTRLGGRGGIAAVVSELEQDGLFEREGVQYLATHAEGSRLAKARTAAAGFWGTALACLRERPAVVHAHSASHASFWRKSLLLLLARRCGCATVFHLHGGGFRRFATEESGPLARWWIRHTLEASAAVVALSEGWAAFLAAYAPAARVHVVPNAVRVAALQSPEATEPGRILFLGRAEASKGVYDLLEALAPLAAQYPHLRLAIGGEGALDAVRARAQALGLGERVELLGWLDARQKAAQLARAAIFCLPSHAEGLPMAMLEAMAVGKPVLMTAVGAIPEAVQDGDNGLLVSPHNTVALSAGLSCLLYDAKLRARLGERARATVAARFSTEAALGKLSAVYRALAGDGR
jgi:glycosyltransferase involved in cell wall biosynthesis